MHEDQIPGRDQVPVTRHDLDLRAVAHADEDEARGGAARANPLGDGERRVDVPRRPASGEDVGRAFR